MRKSLVRIGKPNTGSKQIFFYLGILVLIAGSFFIWQKNKSDIGQKTEAEANDYIVSRMADCHQNNDTNECYEKNAEDFINNFKLSQIMAVFEKKEKTPEFFTKCHLTSHFLGQAAYKKYGSVVAVFSEGSHACLGGIYHGAVEGYFMAQGVTDINDPKLRIEIQRVCGTPADYDKPQKFTECNHGLGHATMYLTKNDLPLALDMCDALTSENERALCYSGALMANGDSFGSTDHPTKYIRADDPLYPCDILKPQQQEQCYTYGVLTRFQQDLPKSISLCAQVPSQFQHQCFKTIGRDRTMLSADPAELKSQCYQIKEADWRRDCVAGTSYNLVIRFGAASDIPALFCGILESADRNECYMNISSALSFMTKDPEIIKNFCEKVQDVDYKNKCLDIIPT